MQEKTTKALEVQPLEVMNVPAAMLNIRTVEVVTALKSSTIYGLIKAKDFPAAILLSKSCARWRVGDITAWLNKRAGVPTCHA